MPVGLRSSPPTRGCSGPRHQEPEPGGVLLADAGVFRRVTGSRARTPCPPCRRRGVPRDSHHGSDHVRSSPPTRGCSDGRQGRHRHRRVLPADAGVFRRLCGPASSACGPPRRRGGAPHYRFAPPKIGGSSPPTRGCSGRSCVPRAGRGVLPADAGVFRRTCRPGARGWCPPRRRRVFRSEDSSRRPWSCPPVDAGVFRPPRRWQEVPRWSSPPTRGCSDEGDDDEGQGDVLPAVAGVFRRGPRRSP